MVISYQPTMKVINADIQVNRQYFLSKIPYDRRKTNRKLTYENKPPIVGSYHRATVLCNNKFNSSPFTGERTVLGVALDHPVRCFTSKWG